MLSLALFWALAASGAVRAQDASAGASSGMEDLKALLRFVPDTVISHTYISYANYRVALAARDLSSISSYAIYQAAGRDAVQRFVAAMPYGGMNASYFSTFDAMPETLGIDFFDIDASLVWGTPPDSATLLKGTFDEASVRVAHLGRGFVETDLKGTPEWCSPDGCDQGLVMDIANRQPADIFGGDLGRRFPRALAGDILFGSGLDTTVAAMQAAGVAGQASLADNRSYAAALLGLDALLARSDGSDGGDLRAAQLSVPDVSFLEPSLDQLPGAVSEEQVRAYQNALRGGEDNLPVYSLYAFADLVDAEAKTETAAVLLVYRNVSMATSAAEVLSARIAQAVSGRAQQPWRELIADRGGEIAGTTVLTPDGTDAAVLVLRLTRPLPGSTPDANGRYVQSGLLYALLINAFNARDLPWLQPVLLR